MQDDKPAPLTTDQIPVTREMMVAGAESIAGVRLSDFISTDLADLPFLWAWAAYIYRQMEAVRAKPT